MPLNSDEVVSPSSFPNSGFEHVAERNPISKALYSEALSTNGRFRRRIRSLEIDVKDLRVMLSNRISKYRDVVSRLERAGNVTWCQKCDLVCKTGEFCACSTE